MGKYSLQIYILFADILAPKFIKYGSLTLYLICQIWALPVQQQIKMSCEQYGQTGIKLSDLVENIVGKEEIARYEQFLLFPQCFQKLSDVDASK